MRLYYYPNILADTQPDTVLEPIPPCPATVRFWPSSRTLYPLSFMNILYKRTIVSVLSLLLFCAIAVLLTGCASTPEDLQWYAGPALESNKVATLKIHQNSIYYFGFIQVIDDVPTVKGNVNSPNNIKQVELLPGPHCIQVFYMDADGRQSLTNAVLSFTCEPGHIYELYAAPKKRSFGQVLRAEVVGGPYRWTAWIVDCENKKVVVGQARDEPIHWYE